MICVINERSCQLKECGFVRLNHACRLYSHGLCSYDTVFSQNVKLKSTGSIRNEWCNFTTIVLKIPTSDLSE